MPEDRTCPDCDNTLLDNEPHRCWVCDARLEDQIEEEDDPFAREYAVCEDVRDHRDLLKV